MTIQFKSLRLILSIAFALLVALVGHANADAEIDQKTLDKVILISKKIESNHLVLSAKTPQDTFSPTSMKTEADLDAWLILLRKNIENNLEDADSTDLHLYRESATRLDARNHMKMADVLQTYIDLKSEGITSVAGQKLLLELEAYQNDSDWYVANQAFYFRALAYLHALNFNASLDSALSALALIPEGQSEKISNAAYDTNSLASGIYSYLANIDMAAKSFDVHIQQSETLGRDVDGLTILNNFAFILIKWGEFETAKTIAETAIEVSKTESNKSQISAHYRHAQALNGLQRYSEALIASEAGLALSPTGSWKLNIQSQLAIAQAGVGETQAALVTLEQIESLAKSDPEYMKRYGARIREARALLAANDNNPMEVFRLMQENQIEATQKLLRNNSDETQKLMGTLSNAKELQRAKEKELNLQNTLKQERIDAQERDAVKMKIIIALLALTAAGIGIFALQQRRVSAREKVLRIQADIGEKAKRDFLAVMSHELRTPLNGIIGLSEILSREGPTEDVKFKNGVIYKSGLSLLDLLTNILDMSKMEGGKVEIERAPADIRDLVNTLGALWMSKAKAQNIDFILDVDAAVPDRLMVDILRVRQCLENLISNAIKFTQTGHVQVQVRYAPDRRKTEKSVLSFVVTDTGPGMSPEKASEVFKPFTQADVSITREFGGSGLGLAITHSLAQLMGGETRVKSVLGAGSEFTLSITAADPARIKKASNITSEVSLRPTIKENIMAAEAKFNSSTEPQLPATELPMPESQPPQPGSVAADIRTAAIVPSQMPEREHLSTAPNMALNALVPPPFPSPVESPSANSHAMAPPKRKAVSADVFKGKKVLVVEDIASNRDVLKIFLSPVGCQVSVAVNGREALESLSSERFDIVLMDVRMPIMDGIEATQALRAGNGPNRDVAVIALTADASPMSNAKCMAAGADVFLTKPVVADELFGAMRFVLAQAARNRAKTAQATSHGFAPALDTRVDVKGVA